MVRTPLYARATLLALFFAVSYQFPASAQTATVAVSGIVKDASGATLAGATVEAVAAGRTVTSAATRENGSYQLQIAKGVPFELRVRKDGFADFVASVSGSAQDVSRDVTLQIGAVSDTVVVTASRGSEGRASLTQSVTVTTSEEMQAFGAAALSDALGFVPGVYVERYGREGAISALFARGGESDYNLVIVDGVRMNQAGGQFDVGRIAASEIDRVEVVRGAQSALWGSDAMGSVVQVFTRRENAAARPAVLGSVEAGSYNTWRGDLRAIGGTRGRVDYQAGVAYRRSDGAFDDLLPQEDWFEQTAFDAGVGVMLGQRANLRTAIRFSRAQGRSVENITFGARDTGSEHDTRDVTWHTDLAHTAGSRFAGTATVTYFDYQSVNADGIPDPSFGTYAVLEGTPGAMFPDGTRLVRLIDEAEFDALAAAGALPAPGQFIGSAESFDFTFHSETRFRRPSIRYQGDYTWATGQRLSAGFEWEQERAVASVGDDTTFDNNAFFIQQQTAIAERWFITAGVRFDAKETYETFVSPKLSAGGYLVAPQAGGLSSVKVFGNIGRGIKSPTFMERLGGSFADPAPDLQVEQARTADVGVEATFADQRLRGSATYFNNEYRDQIAFVFGPVGDGVPEHINIDGSEADGWELELALLRPMGGVTVSGSYALVDTRVVTSVNTGPQFQPGQPLLRRPTHTGTIRAAYRLSRATVHGDVRFVGERHDNSFLGLETVANAEMPSVFTDISVNPGYTVAGIGVDVQLDHGVTAFVRANNITDTTYDSVLGYPGMPRTFMVGARFGSRR